MIINGENVQKKYIKLKYRYQELGKISSTEKQLTMTSHDKVYCPQTNDNTGTHCYTNYPPRSPDKSCCGPSSDDKPGPT